MPNGNVTEVKDSGISDIVDNKSNNFKINQDASKVENKVTSVVLGNIESNDRFCENDYNARNIWGKLVFKLNELHLITLHTACGEIRDVKFEKNVLMVETQEDYLYRILTEYKNKTQIEELLKNIDKRIEVKFNKKTTKTEYSKENLDKLKSLFGKDLNLK